ncbi:integumentary mucin C.1-like isoform X2 [Ostrea edulis]|uniref:integumentary mucin C.1-like isoform X2 n=1 Tax=Ostrea edulis TaxID=37623 RepID=UPI0024AFCBE7|nr:integumentary mucin C.1-like isoform X2 [Ostrea edulis]
MDKFTILRIVIFSILIAYISQTDGTSYGYRRITVYQFSTVCCPGYYGKDCKTVDGGWTDFGAFTKWTCCDVTCGGGITTRKQVRTCTNPAPAHGGKNCSGPSVKIEKTDCNLTQCPDKRTTTTAEPQISEEKSETTPSQTVDNKTNVKTTSSNLISSTPTSTTHPGSGKHVMKTTSKTLGNKVEMTTSNVMTPTTIPTNKSTKLQCKHGVYRADPKHCKNYFLCNYGVEMRMSCPIGTFWDEAKLNCMHADNVDCKKRPIS